MPPGERGAPPGGRGGRGGGRGFGFSRPEIPEEFRAERIMSLPEAELIKLVQSSGSSEFEKAKAAQQLAIVGTSAAVPALASLLDDENLSTYGRFGLEPNNSPEAADALRDAMGELDGALLVGVINSIGQRRDAGAVDGLAGHLSSSDVEVAKAAAAALGRIGGGAVEVLQEALGNTEGDVQIAVAEAGLVAADDLIAQGRRDEGMALLNELSRPEVPKEPRMAAMHLIIAAENTLARPR
jgi:HEAT repeat protein